MGRNPALQDVQYTGIEQRFNKHVPETAAQQKGPCSSMLIIKSITQSSKPFASEFADAAASLSR
ncbi:MAG: hypothetical protein R3B06_26155 [Kofleriaceae bacterium]